MCVRIVSTRLVSSRDSASNPQSGRHETVSGGPSFTIPLYSRTYLNFPNAIGTFSEFSRDEADVLASKLRIGVQFASKRG
jgi:hypothetical protein